MPQPATGRNPIFLLTARTACRTEYTFWDICGAPSEGSERTGDDRLGLLLRGVEPAAAVGVNKRDRSASPIGGRPRICAFPRTGAGLGSEPVPLLRSAHRARRAVVECFQVQCPCSGVNGRATTKREAAHNQIAKSGTAEEPPRVHQVLTPTTAPSTSLSVVSSGAASSRVSAEVPQRPVSYRPAYALYSFP